MILYELLSMIGLIIIRNRLNTRIFIINILKIDEEILLQSQIIIQ